MKGWVAILIPLALIGCAHYQPQPLAPAQRAEAFEARSLDDAGVRSYVEAHSLSNSPASRWNLESLTLAAYYFQPALDVARSQWHVAEAGALTAGARPNPSINFAPGFSANPHAGVTMWLVAAGLDWPIETRDKRGIRITQAKQMAGSARLNLLTAAWQARAKVRDELAAYQFATTQSSLTGEKVTLQKQIVARLEERLQAGALSVSEITPARIALAKLTAELGIAGENESASAARLAESIGIPLVALTNASKELTLYFPQLSAAQISDAKRSALLTRSDLLAALSDYDASETALRLEIAKQYPDIHLNPSYEFDQGENKWRFGIGMDLPVLNRNQGPIAEAKARRDETAARFAALQAKVISEIDTAAQSFQQTRQRYFEIIPSLNAELEHEHALEAQQRAGAVDTLDVLSVRLERLNSVALWHEAGYRATLAYGQLEDATQQVFEHKPHILAAAPPADVDLNPRP